MSFSKNLRSELYYNDIKAKELASLVDIPYTTIQSYMNNKNCLPNIETGVKIADALNVSVEYLVKGNKNVHKDKISDNCNSIVLQLANLPPHVLDLFERLITLVADNLKS